MNQDTDQSVWIAITDWAKERRIVRTLNAQGGDITLTLCNEDKMALIHRIHHIMRHDEERMLRVWRYKAKEFGRQQGKTSATVYRLRCELAESRRINEIDPTAYRGLIDKLRDAHLETARLQDLIKDLEAKLLEQSEITEEKVNT